MKPLTWLTGRSSHAHMKMRQSQNRVGCRDNAAELWAKDILEMRTDLKWTRQAIWGFRLYDFWCGTLGCAVEIDGKDHKKRRKDDEHSDEYHFRRSAIVVLRVPNFDGQALNVVLDHIHGLKPWNQRRSQVGAGKGLTDLPYPPALLPDYL